MARLVICDDNLMLAEALGAALETRGHEVLAIRTTPSLGIAAVDAFQPDVCLLDLHFPEEENGLDVALALRGRPSGTRVLVLSGVDDRAMVMAAMKIGVAGFIRKDQGIEAITEAVETVAAGGSVFDPALRSAMAKPAEGHGRPTYELTRREWEVLSRIVDGQGTNQMALEMQIAPSTLRTYVRNLLTKLGAHSRLQAAALAGQVRVPDSWGAGAPASRPSLVARLPHPS